MISMSDDGYIVMIGDKYYVYVLLKNRTYLVSTSNPMEPSIMSWRALRLR